MEVLELFQIVANGVVETEDVAHPFYLSVAKCELVELDSLEKAKIKVFIKELDKVQN